MSRKPVAVLTGDVHFTVPTLDLATAAVSQALAKASSLGIPLVLNGDTLDTKAIMRAECVNRLLELVAGTQVPIIVNRGNHDQLHERSPEHSLNFLSPYCKVITKATYLCDIESWVIPYQTDPEEFKRILTSIPLSSRVIVHQGVSDSDMGHYVQDPSAVSKSLFENYRGIGSHYHTAQDIQCGPSLPNYVGTFSFIGTPYTTSFAEANDGPKGFQVLYDDGSLELVPTNLRKHVILEYTVDELADAQRFIRAEDPTFYIRPDDLVWVKLSGTSLQLAALDKEQVQKRICLPATFRLDKIITDAPTPVIKDIEKKTDLEILDELIAKSDCPEELVATLQALSRELME